MHQLDLDTLRSIVRSFIDVYPRSYAILATNSLETPVIGLVTRNDDKGFDLAADPRASCERRSHSAADLAIGDDLALLGTFIAGPSALDRLAGDAPINTDDRPIVAYRAPRIVYAADSMPRDRLLALLREVTSRRARSSSRPTPAGALAWPHTGRPAIASSKSGATWSRPDAEQMLAQVREALSACCGSARISGPPPIRCCEWRHALNERDPAAARALLADIARVQPLVTAAQ